MAAYVDRTTLILSLSKDERSGQALAERYKKRGGASGMAAPSCLGSDAP